MNCCRRSPPICSDISSYTRLPSPDWLLCSPSTWIHCSTCREFNKKKWLGFAFCLWICSDGKSVEGGSGPVIWKKDFVLSSHLWDAFSTICGRWSDSIHIGAVSTESLDEYLGERITKNHLKWSRGNRIKVIRRTYYIHRTCTYIYIYKLRLLI